MLNVSDPLYKTVVEPIMERIMEANDLGREYAERFIVDTIHETIPNYVPSDLDIDDRIAEATYDLERRVEDLENDVAALTADVMDLAAIIDERESRGFFARLFSK